MRHPIRKPRMGRSRLGRPVTFRLLCCATQVPMTAAHIDGYLRSALRPPLTYSVSFIARERGVNPARVKTAAARINLPPANVAASRYAGR